MVAALRLVVADSTAPLELPQVQHKGAALRELRSYFLSTPQVMAVSTRRNYTRTLGLACDEGAREGVSPLPEFPAPRDVARWLSELRTSGMKATTVHLHHANLAHVFELGSQHGQTWGNPATVVPWRREIPRRAPLRDVKGVWAFLARCKGLTKRERAFVAALRFTGARKSEILGLEWRHIDLVKRELFIDQQRRAGSWQASRSLKSEAARRVLPLRAELFDMLRELRTEGETLEVRAGLGGAQQKTVPFVFPFREHELARILAVLRGIDPAGFPDGDAWHVFRHTVAVELHGAGKTEAFIQSWLGHASLEKTAVYLRSLAGRRVDARELAGLDTDYRPRRRSRRRKDEAPAAVGIAASASNALSQVLDCDGARCSTIQPTTPGPKMTPSQAVLAAAIESNSSQPSSAPPFSSSASLLPVSSPSLPSASEREVCKLGAEAHEPGDATRKRGQSPGEFDTDVCARCRFERGTHHEAERVGGVCASFVESTEGATPDSSQRSGVAGGGVVALGKRATGRAAESGAAERACEEAKSETGEGGPGEGGARASSGASAAAGPFSALVYLRQSHASMRVELVQLAALLDVLRRGPGSIAPAVIDSAVERAESALAGLTCAEQEVPLLEGLAEELNAATGREVWLREQLDAESDASERYLRDMERTRSENCDLRTQLSDATRRHSESTSNWLDKVAREQTVLREQAKALDALAEIVEASDDPLARARWRASGAKAARESFAALGLEVRQ